MLFAVVIRESGEPGRIESSADLVQSQVAPRVRRAPGFVSALWMSDGTGATLNVITFDSVETATAALEAARSSPRPPFMKLEGVELFRVLASA